MKSASSAPYTPPPAPNKGVSMVSVLAVWFVVVAVFLIFFLSFLTAPLVLLACAALLFWAMSSQPKKNPDD
jgi:hypothetical protein